MEELKQLLKEAFSQNRDWDDEDNEYWWDYWWDAGKQKEAQIFLDSFNKPNEDAENWQAIREHEKNDFQERLKD